MIWITSSLQNRSKNRQCTRAFTKYFALEQLTTHPELLEARILHKTKCNSCHRETFGEWTKDFYSYTLCVIQGTHLWGDKHSYLLQALQSQVLCSWQWTALQISFSMYPLGLLSVPSTFLEQTGLPHVLSDRKKKRWWIWNQNRWNKSINHCKIYQYALFTSLNSHTMNSLGSITGVK